jgi:hypothetical protein
MMVLNFMIYGSHDSEEQTKDDLKHFTQDCKIKSTSDALSAACVQESVHGAILDWDGSHRHHHHRL